VAELVWGNPDQRHYENGVDRGVLYPDRGRGIVWSGLVTVEEGSVGGDVTAYHFDGVKYLDVASPRDYQATITAFSAPDAFGPALGEKSVVPGFILTRQIRTRFNFSYRTMIDDSAYKIHIVYNAAASPNSRGYSSLDGSADAKTLAWTIDAVPPKSKTYRPSAHFVVDSTKTDPDALAVLEGILYGSSMVDSRLVTVDELIGIVGIWSPLVVVPNSVTGYADLISGLGDLYRTSVPGILHTLPDTRLAPTSYESGIYRLES
jgi:hypothetical protein